MEACLIHRLQDFHAKAGFQQTRPARSQAFQYVRGHQFAVCRRQLARVIVPVNIAFGLRGTHSQAARAKPLHVLPQNSFAETVRPTVDAEINRILQSSS